MKKNLVQDVVPGKKSIRNVDLPLRSRGGAVEEREQVKDVAPRPRKQPVPEEVKEEEYTRPVQLKQEAPMRIEPVFVAPPQPPYTPPTNSYKYEYDEPKRSNKKITYLALFILLIAGLFGVSAFFKSAKITITPEQQTKTFNESITATKAVSATGLSYQTVTLTKEVETSVEATSEQKVDKKATGKIIIYNNTSQTQKLVATTRFETPEGLIYRISTGVSIPAKQTIGGKSVAGSIEAVVEADKTGANYNIGMKDFTIPGFKGDDKYTLIFARSKTEMTGGFSGMQKVVSKEIMDAAGAELESMLRDSVSKDILSQIPTDYVLYANSITYVYGEPNVGTSATGGAVLKKKATGNAIIFDRAVLAKVLVSKVLPEAGDAPIRVTNLDSLEFAYGNSAAFDPNTSSVVIFTLKGEANFVWVVDENKLKSDLLGLSKKSARSMIPNYGVIKEAWVETSPFWNQTIPLDPKKVTIVNTLTK